MIKIAVNMSYGGFSLSDEAITLYYQMKGFPLYKIVVEDVTYYSSIPEKKIIDLFQKSESRGNFNELNSKLYQPDEIPRDDPALIATIEKLGTERASGECSEIGIAAVPDDVDWIIVNFDGQERVEEKHSYWSGDTK